jgi:hypothetical protein
MLLILVEILEKIGGRKKDKNECHLHLANYQDYSLASQINTVRGIAFFHFITLRECKP